MPIRILLAIVILGCAASLARAQPTPQDAYRQIVTEVIRPGFDGLADQARRHQVSWMAYCRAPSAEGLAQISASFHALSDSWAGIAFIRSGPASEDFRHERFSFWPERKNAVERGLAALLKRPDAALLDAREIRRQSAAVQGLPALERLIYAGGQPDAQLGEGSDGQIRCEAGEAISANAAELAAEMAAAWTKEPAEATQEARARLASDIVTAFAILKDLKIEAVIGKEAGQVKPRAAEFWRSGRPMRNIILNLEVLAKLNDILFPDAADDIALPHATRTALAIARSIHDLADAASGSGRSNALLLRDAVGAAEDRAIIEVPQALGVTIGFNSLDGD